MNDPIAAAVLVADRLRSTGKAATKINIDAEFRALAAEGWQLRTGVHHRKENHMHDYTPPDSYAEGLQQLRRELPSNEWPRRLAAPTLPLDRNGVPDPYAAGLAKMRREDR